MGHLFTFVFVYFSEVVFWVGDSGLRHGIKFFWADELLMRQFCGGFTFKTLGEKKCPSGPGGGGGGHFGLGGRLVGARVRGSPQEGRRELG